MRALSPKCFNNRGLIPRNSSMFDVNTEEGNDLTKTRSHTAHTHKKGKTDRKTATDTCRALVDKTQNWPKRGHAPQQDTKKGHVPDQTLGLHTFLAILFYLQHNTIRSGLGFHTCMQWACTSNTAPSARGVGPTHACNQVYLQYSTAFECACREGTAQ